MYTTLQALQTIFSPYSRRGSGVRVIAGLMIGLGALNTVAHCVATDNPDKIKCADDKEKFILSKLERDNSKPYNGGRKGVALKTVFYVTCEPICPAGEKRQIFSKLSNGTAEEYSMCVPIKVKVSASQASITSKPDRYAKRALKIVAQITTLRAQQAKDEELYDRQNLRYQNTCAIAYDGVTDKYRRCTNEDARLDRFRNRIVFGYAAEIKKLESALAHLDADKALGRSTLNWSKLERSSLLDSNADKESHLGPLPLIR